MVLLASGVLLFAAVHLIIAVPALKAKLKARLGAGFGAIFGISSTVTLLLIIFGWRAADFVYVYDPPDWGRFVTFGMVLAAFICLGVFIFRGRLRQILRLPLSLGVIFWGTGHLFANGDQASLILFGGMIAYGLAHLCLGIASGYRPSADVRAGHDLMSLLGGLALYGLMTQLHVVLIGVPVISLS